MTDSHVFKCLFKVNVMMTSNLFKYFNYALQLGTSPPSCNALLMYLADIVRLYRDMLQQTFDGKIPIPKTWLYLKVYEMRTGNGSGNALGQDLNCTRAEEIIHTIKLSLMYNQENLI